MKKKNACMGSDMNTMLLMIQQLQQQWCKLLTLLQTAKDSLLKIHRLVCYNFRMETRLKLSTAARILMII